MSVHLFGIRHHGPGSARSLLTAFDELEPDVVLIEAPADADGLLRWVGDPGLRPPVALLGWVVAETPHSLTFRDCTDRIHAARAGGVEKTSKTCRNRPEPRTVTGTVTLVDPEHDILTLEENDGQTRFYHRRGRSGAMANEVRVGDRITLVTRVAGRAESVTVHDN